MAGKGRKKVEMNLIQKPSSRMVCFSKRRKGLFKKAEELSILTGAKISVLAFSQSGKMYCSDTQTLDSLLLPPLDMSSEKAIESGSAEAMAADPLLRPQFDMPAEKEVALDDPLGSTFFEDMIDELYSSDVPTLNNSLYYPALNISTENEVVDDDWNYGFTEAMDGNLYSSDTAALYPLLCSDQFDISAEKEEENRWEFDFGEAMAGKELPFWYDRADVQSMGYEELCRLERAIMEYGQMQLAKNCY